MNTNDENSNQEKLEVRNNVFKNFVIKIQCPDCGFIFILNEKREYFCYNCQRVYTENEIRARCGL